MRSSQQAAALPVLEYGYEVWGKCTLTKGTLYCYPELGLSPMVSTAKVVLTRGVNLRVEDHRAQCEQTQN